MSHPRGPGRKWIGGATIGAPYGSGSPGGGGGGKGKVPDGGGSGIGKFSLGLKRLTRC